MQSSILVAISSTLAIKTAFLPLGNKTKKGSIQSIQILKNNKPSNQGEIS